MTSVITETLIRKIHKCCGEDNVYALVALLALALKNKTSLSVQQLLFKFDVHPSIISDIENSDWTYQQVISFLSEDFHLYD